MPTVKQLVVIAVAIAMAIVGASAFGIGAAENSATGGIERHRALQGSGANVVGNGCGAIPVT